MIDSAAHTRGEVTPHMLSGMRSLELRARLLVEGLVSGMHRSPYRGFSVEFTEHRKYSQGDDLKHLDWKVFGRKDKYFVKQYEQETNLRMMLVIDASASMNYRSDPKGLTKYDYATVLAAGMAHLVQHQADAVGVVTFDDHVGRIVPASNKRGQAAAIIRELEREPAGKKTRIGAVLDALAEQLKQRHLIVLISDLLDNDDDILRGLRHLRHRRHEPIVLHVLDHAELTFPFTRRTRFEGLEDRPPLITEPRSIRKRYLEAVRRFTERMRRGCHEIQADFAQFDTRDALDMRLSEFLATRAHRL